MKHHAIVNQQNELGVKRLLLAAAMGVAAVVATACGSSTATPTGPGAGGNSGRTASTQPAVAAGKDITNFDACSVVSDTEYVQAITASASDPSALGTINATHAPVDGPITGLPGAKACKLSYTTTDSAGRLSQGSSLTVTFDKYSYLAEIQGSAPIVVNDYASAGAQAFEGPGDAGDPHITKDGYLFRLTGGDSNTMKTIALGIASRI